MCAALIILWQLRESIAHDQEKTKSLNDQVQNLEKEIEEVDAKIKFTEAKLKDLRKVQEQITEISATRSASFKEMEQRYQALDEDIEGLSLWKESRIGIALVLFMSVIIFFTSAS